MLEQLDRSRLIGILFFFSIYWTFVLSSEFIRRTWMSVPGSEALIMYFLAFISSLACLAFLISILPRTVALFLILLLGLASSAANVFRRLGFYTSEEGRIQAQKELEEELANSH